MDRQILKYLGYFQLQLKNMLVKKVSQMIKGSRYICLRFEGLKKDLKKSIPIHNLPHMLTNVTVM